MFLYPRKPALFNPIITNGTNAKQVIRKSSVSWGLLKKTVANHGDARYVTIDQMMAAVSV